MHYSSFHLVKIVIKVFSSIKIKIVNATKNKRNEVLLKKDVPICIINVNIMKLHPAKIVVISNAILIVLRIYIYQI